MPVLKKETQELISLLRAKWMPKEGDSRPHGKTREVALLRDMRELLQSLDNDETIKVQKMEESSV